jgi:hypothetical protein
MAGRRSQEDLGAAMRNDPERKGTTAERMKEDLRVRREDPAIIPAPQEPINAPVLAPDIDPGTAVYEHPRRWSVIRGGVSLPAILTGAFVAMGAMVLVMAITAGLLAATGVISSDGTVQNGSFVRATVLTGVGLVVAQFLAYLWGGYTAGRMARGAGALNGLLVPIVAIIVAAGIGALVGYLGTSVHLNYSFQTTRLPIDRDLKIHLGMGIAAVGLFAMFVGGIVGGVRGARWHGKLERAALPAEDRAAA